MKAGKNRSSAIDIGISNANRKAIANGLSKLLAEVQLCKFIAVKPPLEFRFPEAAVDH